MGMNKKQITVFWVAVTLVALVGIFPPQYSSTTVGTPERPSRPTRTSRPVRIQRESRTSTEGESKTDTGKLIGYWVVIGSVGAALIYTMRDKKNNKDKKGGLGTMNKKQLISMWCGIVAIVIVGLYNLLVPYSLDYNRFCLWVFIVALVTGGLIYTLRDKQSKKDKDD